MNSSLLLKAIPAAVLASLLITGGCSSNNNNNHQSGGEPEPPVEVPVSLDATGIYDGTLETDSGDVALVRLVLGRGGETSINLQTDDSGRANRILWGNSDGSDAELTFTGDDTANGTSVTVSLAIDADTVSGQLDLTDIKGNFQLSRNASSDAEVDLAALAGDYARTNVDGTLTRLQIAADGTVTVDGACDGSGSVASIDAQVNIYQLSSTASCLSVDGLFTVETLAAAGDVLSVSGVSDSAGYAADFYRL